MLDYISRANEIKICRSCLSVHHPSLALSLNLSHGFLSNFILFLGCPGSHTQIFFFYYFWIFEKKKHLFFFFFKAYFSFLFKHGTSKRHSSSNHFGIFSNFSWIFFLVVLTKVLFGIFEILSLWFFSFPEFSSQWSSQKYCFDFWNFEFLIFNEFLNFTIVPYGETKDLISGKQATIERNGVKFEPCVCVYRALLAVKCVRSFWGHLVHFRF